MVRFDLSFLFYEFEMFVFDEFRMLFCCFFGLMHNGFFEDKIHHFLIFEVFFVQVQRVKDFLPFWGDVGQIEIPCLKIYAYGLLLFNIDDNGLLML